MIFFIILLVETSGQVKGGGKIVQPFCDTFTQEDLRPQLQWQQNSGGFLHLEIYYSVDICNFSSLQPNQEVTNPSCIATDAPLDADHTLKVEFFNISTWKSDSISYSNNTNGPRFSIEKALFRLPAEEIETVKCELQFTASDSHLEITKTQRSNTGEASAFLEVIYNPPICSTSNCTYQILRQVSQNLNNILQNKTKKLRIEAMQNDFIPDGSQRVTFRVRERRPSAGADAFLQEERLIRWLRGRGSPLLRVGEPRGAHFCARDGRWPATRAGAPAVITPPGACGRVAVRRCMADPRRGARWEDADDIAEGRREGRCNQTFFHSHRLQDLADRISKYDSKAGSQELHEVENILNNVSNKGLSEVDIWNVAQILESTKDPSKLNIKSIATATNIFNSMLLLDEAEQEPTLQILQQKTGTSNMLLQSLDHILSEAPLNSSKELVVKEKITTLILNTGGKISTSITQGIGVRKQNDTSFNIQNIVEIPHNASVEWIISQEFSTAVILPKSLIYSLSRNSHQLAFSIFWNSKLFGGTDTQHISGHVVGVSIDGKHMELQEPILLLFGRKSEEVESITSSEETNICGFWNFEADNGNGNWTSAGCTLAKYSNNYTDICICTHMTHFGKLLYNPGKSETSHYQESFILNIVTVIGCSLSLLGLAGVFLSAALFPGEGTGRWIQLQLCAAQAILMVAVLWDATSTPRVDSSALCLMRGLLLHWSVLALGIWTLAAAIYQHRRLTQPLHALHTDPRFLPIATTLSWGCPAIVCVIVMVGDSKAYIPQSCYPSGITLILSVVIPLGCIVVTNTVIFLLIIWSICNCGPQTVTLRDSQNDKTRVMRRVLASSYLFCLLGLCWLFGFLHMQYLFCVTASMQGVSHFIFCVLLDRTTRRSWQLYKKRSHLHFSSIKSWARTSILSSPKSKHCSVIENEKTRKVGLLN